MADQPFRGRSGGRFGQKKAPASLANVPSYQHVHRQQEQQLKTIDRWGFRNVSNIASRLEREQAERKRKEEEEAEYWRNRKKQARANWARLATKQQGKVLQANDRVVVRSGDNNELCEPKLYMGVISSVNDDGTYAVQYVGETPAETAIVRDNIILAPDEDEALFVGARVGVKFPNTEDLFMGVITAINPDGTYAVQYDGGTTHSSIARRAITLFHNEPLYLGARVEYAAVQEDGRSKSTAKPRQGIITKSNDDDTYEVRYEGGQVVSNVPRHELTLDHSLPVEFGTRVGVKFPNKPKPYMGVITKLNDDGTFAVRYDGGSAHASIARHMITVYPKDTLGVGDRASVKFPKFPGKQYLGKINRINPDGTYAVLYDNGSQQENISREQITKLDADSADGAGAAAANGTGAAAANSAAAANGVGSGDGADDSSPNLRGNAGLKDWRAGDDGGSPSDRHMPGKLPKWAPGGGTGSAFGDKHSPSKLSWTPGGNQYGNNGPPSTLARSSIVTDQLAKIRARQLKEQQEENERRRWLEERRRKEPRNWAAWLKRQKEAPMVVGTAVVVRGAALDEGLRKGVIVAADPARDTYTIKFGDGSEQTVARPYMLVAPKDSSPIYEGARVGVIDKASGPEVKMAVVNGVSPDGKTFTLTLDDGTAMQAVPRDALTLFYNDALNIGDRVLVKGSGGKQYTGVISGVNGDGTYVVNFDSGGSSEVPRQFISVIPPNVSIMAGDVVNFDGAQQGAVSNAAMAGGVMSAIVVAVNPDNSYMISSDDGESVQLITRHDIKAYHNGTEFVPARMADMKHSHGFIDRHDSEASSSATVPVVVDPGVDTKAHQLKMRAGRAKENNKFLDFSSTVKMMSAGAEFVRFHYDRRETIFMYYLRPQEGGELPSGSLHWCPPGTKEKIAGQCINLRTISDIFMGKKPGVFESDFKAEARSKKSFSIIVKDKPREPFNFTATEQEVRTQWINGINTVITAQGKKVQVAYKHDYRENKGSGQTLKRYPTLRPARTLMRTHKPKTYDPKEKIDGAEMMRHATLASYSSKDMLEMMAGGSDFTAYSETDAGSLKQNIFLFYVAGVGPGQVGILYWCDPTPENRVASTENSLPVAHISGVHLGKQSEVLKNDGAKDAVWNKCLSIYSYDGMHDLHLEARVPQQVSAWLEGINSILS